jgi:glycolate oxidase FAD binding subunit
MEHSAIAQVVEPETTEAVARVLRDASASGRKVVIRGGGTKSSWGREPRHADLVLSTSRLSRVLAHAAGDLTVSCEPGVPLHALNTQLAVKRQWLPLDSAFEEATIGGILATNDSGPLRHRYGTPRDLLIGVQLATTDGKVVKAGGQVVKNVAGYDLGKLVTGSFGSLAAIVAATFKLTPLPSAWATCRWTFADLAAAVDAAAALAATDLDPVALEVHFRAGQSGVAIEILIRFASTPPGVEAQMPRAERCVHPFGPLTTERLADEADAAVWSAHGRRIWTGTGTIAKSAWLPASLGAVFTLLARAGREGTTVEIIGRAGVGAGLVRIDGNAGMQVALARELRERTDLFTQVSLLRAPAEVTSTVDAWGPPASTASLLGAIKRAFDPAGVLTAGRGPL